MADTEEFHPPIQVEGIGPISFPASMTAEEIEKTIRTHPDFTGKKEINNKGSTYLERLWNAIKTSQEAQTESGKMEGAVGGQVLRGIPIVGSAINRTVSPSTDEQTLLKSHPNIATAARIGGGVAGGLGQAAATGGMSLLPGMAANAGINAADLAIGSPNASPMEYALNMLLGAGGHALNRVGQIGKIAAAEKAASEAKQAAEASRVIPRSMVPEDVLTNKGLDTAKAISSGPLAGKTSSQTIPLETLVAQSTPEARRALQAFEQANKPAITSGTPMGVDAFKDAIVKAERSRGPISDTMHDAMAYAQEEAKRIGAGFMDKRKAVKIADKIEEAYPGMAQKDVYSLSRAIENLAEQQSKQHSQAMAIAGAKAAEEPSNISKGLWGMAPVIAAQALAPGLVEVAGFSGLSAPYMQKALKEALKPAIAKSADYSQLMAELLGKTTTALTHGIGHEYRK